MIGMTEDITVDHPVQNVTRIALNRPKTRNAYRTQTCLELEEAVRDFEADDASRVLILTGSGGAFCSGGDIAEQEPEARQLLHGMTMREGMHRVTKLLWSSDKPSIAAVGGPAVSGGLALALCCDFRVGSASARLGDASGRVGLLPDEGGAWLFPRVIGRDAAIRMTLLAEIYDADKSLALGLLTEVVEDADLEQRTLELASQLARTAPLAARLAKRMIRQSANQTFEQSLADAEYAVEIVNGSEDVREGVAAFIERRPPVYRGR